MARKAIPEMQALMDAPIGTILSSPCPGAEHIEKVSQKGWSWRGIESGGQATSYGAYWRGYRALAVEELSAA